MISNIFVPKKWIVLGFMSIGVFILPVILLYPFNVDTDRWQWIASVFVRYGGLPYTDAWDHDFPGVLIVHATAIYVFGNSMLGFRVMEYLIVFFTFIALYRTCRLWLSESESFWGCLLFSLFYVYGRWDCMGQRDNFAVLPVVLSCFFFIRSFRHTRSLAQNWLMVAGGIMVGMATCIRPTYVLLLAVPFFSLYKITNIRAMAFACVGLLFPLLIMITPFVLTPNGLHQAYASAVLFNTDVYSHIPPTAARFALYLRNLLELRTVMIFVLIAVWITIYAIGRSRKKPCMIDSNNERIFLVLTMVTLLVGMFAQQSLSACHFTPFYALFIPVMGKTLVDITGYFKRWQPVAIALTLIGISAILYPWGLVRLYFEGHFSTQTAYGYFGPTEGIQESDAIASFLVSHTNENDYVEVVGDPGISWRTPRRKSTPYPDPWTFLYPNFKGQITGYEREWRLRFSESLFKNAPKYIVIQKDPGENADSLFSMSVSRATEVKSYIQQNYTLDTVYHSHAIYRRKGL